MLKLEQLTVAFGDRTILDQLDLNLSCGQCVGLIGANGAGKSTLFKSISQEIAYQGTVRWQEHDLRACSTQALACLMGVLPQTNHLTFPFTVEEVVLLGRMMHSTSNKENKAIVFAMMEKFDIVHLANQNYMHLSGGEKQRVHAARVWCQLYYPDDQRARILLLDEPTSALDLRHQHQLLGVARTFAGQGNLVLTTLHDLNLAARYCDYLVLLHKAQIIAQGAPKSVLTSENIQEAYGYQAQVIEQAGQYIIC